MLKFFYGLAALFLSACDGLAVYAVNLPVKFEENQVSKNISYGRRAYQSADIYRSEICKKDCPVIVFFYGGGWVSGEKETYPFLARAFTDQGYVVVIPDYAKYPDVKFPEFIKDGAKALSFVEKNIAAYNGDPNNIIIAGHSAGAHLGAMLTYNPLYLQDEKFDHSRIKAFFGFSGPYAFTPEEEPYIDIFGPPEKYPEMKVTNFVSENPIPAYLFNGVEDNVVPTKSMCKLAVSIHANNGSAVTKRYEDTDHIDMISAFSYTFGREDIRKDVFQLLKKALERSPSATVSSR